MKRFFVVLFMLVSVSAYGKDLTDTMVTKPTVTLGSGDTYEVFVSYSSAGTGRQLRRITDSSILKLGGVDTTTPDGKRYLWAYNTAPFSETPEAGMFHVTPTGPEWYGTVTGITDWHTVGGASSLSQLTDWPSGVSDIEVGFLDGVTSPIQTQINEIVSGNSGYVSTPTFSNSACSPGQWSVDSAYHYLCKASNTWDRIAFDTPAWTNLADTTPTTESIAFIDQTNVALNSIITSAPITVDGINTPAPITVTGGTYSVAGGAYTSNAGTVANGQTVTARHTSAATNSTATNTVITIGGVSDTFTSTTLAAAISEILRPNGGGTANWTASSGAYPAHNTDLADNSDSTYISTAASGTFEKHAFADTASANPIASVTYYVRAKGVNGENLRPYVDNAGTTSYWPTDITLTDSIATYSYTWNTNPHTSAAWTATALNGYSFGVRSGTITGTTYVYDIWIEVTFQ